MIDMEEIKYEIKYSSKEKKDQSHYVNKSELLKNNYSIDLTELGFLIDVYFPEELLLSDKEISVSLNLNIWFDSIKGYEKFLNERKNSLEIDSVMTEKMENGFLDDKGILFERESKYISYKSKISSPSFKFGIIKSFLYDQEEGCAKLNCLISKKITGLQLLFKDQKELMELCSKKIREHKNKELKDLLVHVEDINETNNSDNQLYFVAAWNGNVEVLKLLKEKKAKINEDINIAGSRHLSVLKYLKKESLLNVNYKDKDGYNPLQQSCVIQTSMFAKDTEEEKTNKERIASIDFLVKEGVEINIVNNEGRTALMTCASQSNYDLSKKLIDLGADINIECKAGKIFTDYSSNEYYTNYFLFCFKNYNTLYLLYKNIEKDLASIGEFPYLERIFNDLYLILNLDNDDQESRMKCEAGKTPITTKDYREYEKSALYLHLKIKEDFVNLLENIYKEYKENNSVNIENIYRYNEFINKFEKILKEKSTFLFDKESIFKNV